QVTVTVANYNFRSIRAVCSVVVYNAAGERQTTSVKTFDIPGYVPYATYSGNASMWQTFRYGDQPLNVPCTVDLSDVEIPEGGYIVTQVFSNDGGNYLTDLRRDVLLSGTTLPAGIQTVIPAGYQLIDSDANSPSSRFIAAVAACADKQSDELRLAIVDAYRLYNQADYSVAGVSAAREQLAAYLAAYNDAVGQDNARMQDGLAVLHAATPQLLPLWSAVLVALWALIRRLIVRM
ncbi:MAG: hypothetical protein J6125_03935, partial [Clostridia bacterium]|nr:hypothetical protein [Clostridia bacterium]